MTARPGVGTRVLLTLPTVLLAIATIAAAGVRLLRPEPALSAATAATPVASAEAIPHVDAPAAMPPAASDAERGQLYGTPGGLYTATDIQANGKLSPIQRYGNIPIQHDLHPQPGTIICPVTRTRANPRIVWTVGGQRYLFCCPSCIDEFVRRARTTPGSVLPPREYVQR